MDGRSYCTEYYFFSDKKQLAAFKNVQVQLKGVLIDLRARNFVYAKTSLRARCMYARHQTQLNNAL